MAISALCEKCWYCILAGVDSYEMVLDFEHHIEAGVLSSGA